MQHDITVIGAGIVGITNALELQARGFHVQILDRTGVAAETSQGNAGAFAFAEVEPLATPGIMRKAPKWLLDPLGPLSIPPAYALQIMPWMLRFWRASWRDRYTAGLSAQAKLMDLSSKALTKLIPDMDGEHLIQRDGQMQLYEGEAQFRASLPSWELRGTHGIEHRLLRSPEEIAEIQPGLSKQFTHGGFTPGWINTIDPKVWTEHLAKRFVERGGVIKQAEVRDIKPASDGVELTTDTGPLSASKIVVSCGAWSHHLARRLGDHLPLETERGYNSTLPPGALDLRTHLTFSGHGFVVTKIAGGVRVGGAVELGGLKLPPNYKRADALLNKAKRFLPELDTSGGKQWMGHRPSMPDSLPVIGYAPRSDRVIYAFGHGHLGLTQSAGTAQLVADLATDQAPALDLTPYRPTRF